MVLKIPPTKLTVLIIKAVLVFALSFALFLSAESTQHDWFDYLSDDEEYGIYRMLRFVSFTCFSLLAYKDLKRQDRTLLFIWIVSALLINPFFQFSLGKPAWQILDWVWILFVIGTEAYDVWKERTYNS